MEKPDFYCKNYSVKTHQQALYNFIGSVLKAFGKEVLEEKPCDRQCFDCMADVGETRLKNKNVPKTNTVCLKD